ncbi:carbonic anhydrase [Teredinibacter turnerae]|uniref:carbonic anhydrase n=1 Tax=Teredinibacter turnerae (strain ATCC 39867 / T7901) TaxID=377629 RepID=C5BLD9_TERTT|nr:carbonic anhydrase [Teredinibacter turnerae]ACR13974.1 carbonate dehydratase [Teredinibacter turnerae T7901]
MISADEAITRLKEGNQRFVAGVRSVDAIVKQMNLADHAQGQAPFAIVLGCSDSRVPAEIIFDQSLGDLFVIRVAGNIVAPSQVGSVEFAAETFGTPLVIVLGHTRCGAINATLDLLEKPAAEQSSNVMSIVNRIRPAVEPLFHTELRNDREKLVPACIHANIMASTNQLSHGSEILEQLVEQGKLKIVGAEYSLETGEVTFFD